MEKVVFVEKFGGIFEHSPWIAERAWSILNQSGSSAEGVEGGENIHWDKLDLTDFHQTMVEVVKQASLEEKLSLLTAHPQLAGKEAQTGNLTDASTGEQASAKLNALSREEMEMITRLNQEYLSKFGFPFIIAVKNHTKESIFSEFQRRVNHTKEQELETALEEVYKIAKIRLAI